MYNHPSRTPTPFEMTAALRGDGNDEAGQQASVLGGIRRVRGRRHGADVGHAGFQGGGGRGRRCYAQYRREEEDEAREHQGESQEGGPDELVGGRRDQRPRQQQGVHPRPGIGACEPGRQQGARAAGQCQVLFRKCRISIGSAEKVTPPRPMTIENYVKHAYQPRCIFDHYSQPSI